jgi:type IV pilus assembly protein PilV
MGRPYRVRGFSLLEVMVAVAVFSTGFGGLSLLLLLAVQHTAASRWQAVAASRLHSMAELQAASPAVVPASPLYLEWQASLAEALPGGAGVVCLDATPADGSAGAPACDGRGGRVVKVFWTEPPSAGHALPESRRLATRLGPP